METMPRPEEDQQDPQQPEGEQGEIEPILEPDSPEVGQPVPGPDEDMGGGDGDEGEFAR
jgi:hypothetical protein